MVAARDIIEPKAFPFTLPYSTLSFVNGIIASYLVLYADERGIMGVSVYFTVYAVFLFLIRPLAGKLMDAKGIQYTVFPGMILTALSMFLLGRSSTLWMILLTALLRAIGQGAAQPSLQAGCINYVGRDRSGVATSTYFLGGDIGQGIGPMVGGALLGRVAGLAGYQLVFSLCGALILLAMTYFYFARRNGRLS
jgi:MFS family permease